MTMRTADGERRYDKAKQHGNLIPLYEEPAVYGGEFKHWRIVANRFPHNKITDLNDMLVLKRECDGLTHIKMYEWFELLQIILKIRDSYDTFTFNFPSMSSIKNIPHAHLYRLKKEFK